MMGEGSPNIGTVLMVSHSLISKSPPTHHEFHRLNPAPPLLYKGFLHHKTVGQPFFHGQVRTSNVMTANQKDHGPDSETELETPLRRSQRRSEWMLLGAGL